MSDTPLKSEGSRDSSGRFAKGNPGGPGRKPSECSIPSLLKSLGEQELPNGKTRYQVLCERLWDEALGGDRHSREIILSRILGTPKQTVEQTTDSRIEVVYTDGEE